jgi:ubiquinone biosynthesis protein UbiJ
MAATAAWLASVEALLNRGIDGSARAGALARRLQGTSLQIDVDGIGSVRLSAQAGRLMLLAADPASDADAGISGSPAALLALFQGGSARRSGGPHAQVRGDAEIANRYRDLLLLARPDPEEELSRWVGDFAARRLSQFAQRAFDFGRRVRRTAGENIAEYLQEEGRDLVNRPELGEFLNGVDELREAADRIEARLGRLEQRLRDGA